MVITRWVRHASGTRLSTRFAVCVAVLVPLLVVLAGLLMLSLASHDLRAERDSRLKTRLRALTPMATTYANRVRLLPRLPADYLAGRLTGASVGADTLGGMRVDLAGGSPPLVAGEVPKNLPSRSASAPATYEIGSGERWRYVAADLGPGGASGRLWVFEPEDYVDQRLDLLRERLGLVALAAVVIGAAAGFGLARLAVQPLTVLRGQAQAIDTSATAGGRLATGSGVVEIDELARLVNDLLDRRDTAVARTSAALDTARAFAATAAHELRTPLTSMGTNLSLLGRPDLDPAERADVATDLIAEHTRLQRLITMLRQLARGELVDPDELSRTDLAEIVDAAVDEARSRHPKARITALLSSDDMFVRGWPEGLRLIVDNLLDNAAVHGANGSGNATITITLTTEPTPPTTEPATSAAEPVAPVAKPAAPVDETVISAARPVAPAAEAATSAAEWTTPTVKSTAPVAEAATSAAELVAPAAEPAASGAETVAPTVKPMTLGVELESVAPAAEAATSGAELVALGVESMIPAVGATDPVVEAVAMGAEPAAPVALLIVEDHGPGIADRRQAFVRFQRGPGSPGSGLGLTLVEQQATLHGGRVTLADPAEGARVEVRLPLIAKDLPKSGAKIPST